MDWNKVNLKAKDKNLPDVGKWVVWATNQDSPDKNVFWKFFGKLSQDGKYVDTGIKRYKLTSKFWWGILNNPEI